MSTKRIERKRPDHAPFALSPPASPAHRTSPPLPMPFVFFCCRCSRCFVLLSKPERRCHTQVPRAGYPGEAPEAGGGRRRQHRRGLGKQQLDGRRQRQRHCALSVLSDIKPGGDGGGGGGGCERDYLGFDVPRCLLHRFQLLILVGRRTRLRLRLRQQPVFVEHRGEGADRGAPAAAAPQGGHRPPRRDLPHLQGVFPAVVSARQDEFKVLRGRWEGVSR